MTGNNVNEINNIVIMAGNNINKIVTEIFTSLLTRYQMGSETSMKCNNFVSDGMNEIYYKFI